MRIAVGLEYAGSSYHGWQKQQLTPNTVQQYVEEAFSRVADQPLQIICAGRTDAGVHATNQVIHFDTDAERSDYAWVCGANSYLPRDISIHWAKVVTEDFHARFSAVSRRYHYWIYNHSSRPGILQQKVTWHLQPLDADKMHQAAQHLIGEHDFSSFRAKHCQAKSPIRTVHDVTVTRHGPYIKIDICANAFLHHMVRNITGVLLAIGEGKAESDWMQTVLTQADRTAADITAPPDGLYLTTVEYPPEFQILQHPAICYTGE